MRGKLADKTYRIGEQKWQIVNHHFAHRGIECRKEFVFGKDIALAQHIHKSRLAGIGISDESHTGKLATVFALNGFLLVNIFELLFKQRYTAENYTTVGLNLSLAGDPSCLYRPSVAQGESTCA